MMADLMDEQELATGRRQEGVFSAAISFSAKATSSLGLIIGGSLLDFVIAFPTQADIGTVDDKKEVASCQTPRAPAASPEEHRRDPRHVRARPQ